MDANTNPVSYWSSGLQFLDGGNYISVNRTLVRALGLYEAVLIGELASEARYWLRFGELEDGWFYSTVENVERATGISPHCQRVAVKRLEELGLVQTTYKGLPRKRYFRLDAMRVVQYVAEFEDLEEHAVQEQCFTNCTTGGPNVEPLDAQILNVNNNKEQQQGTTTRKKEERGKKKDAETFDSIIDGFTDDEALRESLRGFVEFRKSIRKPLTLRALRLNVGKLSKIARGPEEMAAVVDQTVMNGWMGFYPLKDSAVVSDSDVRDVGADRYQTGDDGDDGETTVTWY